ncbi:MAG: KEOPS complex subunit Pcc1 [Thermogladius sp.]
MENKVELEVRGVDENIARSIVESLRPEIESLPETCRGGVELKESTLRVVVLCSRIGLLRAVVNSIISTISMLMELKAVIEG